MAIRGLSLVPSAATKTLLCVDHTEHLDFSGRLFNPYFPDIYRFSGIYDIMRIMEDFFDRIAFPQAFYNTREFTPQKAMAKGEPETVEVVRYRADSLFDAMYGELATYTVQVLLRQNATWQGILSWGDGRKTMRFRSTLEMLEWIGGDLEQQVEPFKRNRWI